MEAFSLVGSWLALLGVAVPVAAEPGERPVVVRLSRSGRACAQQSLVAAVRRRAPGSEVAEMGSPAGAEALGAGELSAHVEMEHAAVGLVARVRLGTKQTPQRTREIKGQSCPALTDAAALIVALAAERLRAEPPPPEPVAEDTPPPREPKPRRRPPKRVRSPPAQASPPVEEPQATPVTEPPPPAAPSSVEPPPEPTPPAPPAPAPAPTPSEPPSAAAEAPASYRWALSVLGGVQSGLLPEPVFGLGASVDAFAPADSSVDWSLGVWRHAKAELVQAEGTAELTQYRARLAACAGELWSSPWSLRPCIGLEGGVTTTRGHSAFALQQHRRPWLAPALAARFVRWLGRVQLQAQVQGEVPLVRSDLQFLPADPFHEMPFVTWSASLGLGAQL